MENSKGKNPSGYEVGKRNLEPPGYTAFESENMHYITYALSFDFLNSTLFTKVHM